MNSPSSSLSRPDPSAWWRHDRAYTRTEMVCDGVVHLIGIVVAVAAGGALLLVAGLLTAPGQVGPLAVYVGSLLTVLVVSFAFNMAPVSRIKQVLARLDQAAIFLLIAGTYTPMLALLAGTSAGLIMLTFVWSAALVGVALKLFIPQYFGRPALLLYGGIGWSGVVIFNSLAAALPASTLWLLLAGGITYSLGIIFHLWQRLHFHNVLWHCFVVVGASLHLWAVIDCMILHRL